MDHNFGTYPEGAMLPCVSPLSGECFSKRRRRTRRVIQELPLRQKYRKRLDECTSMVPPDSATIGCTGLYD